MASLLKLFAGFAAIAALGIFSIEMDILPGSRVGAEARLQERTERALAAAGVEWARANMQGQKAVLSGEAPDQAALEKAAEAVKRSAWGGGALVGGVASVDASGVAVAQGSRVVDPFVWVAERHGKDVVFSGYAPSAEARDAVYRLAAAYFPGAEISGQLDVAQGAPPEDAWLSAAAASLQALAQLEAGAAEATDTKFEVSGRAADGAKAQTVRTLMNSLPAGISGAADVTAPPQQPPPEETPPPETTADRTLSDEEAAAGEAPAEDSAPAGEDAAAGGEAPEEAADAAAAEGEAGPEAGVETEEDADETAAGAAAPPPSEPGDAPVQPAEPDAAPARDAEPVDAMVLAECRSRLERLLIGLQVSFASEGTTIEPGSQEPLRELATALMVCPYFTVRITGHTDASGSEIRNRRLSRERAEAIAGILRSFGVDPVLLATRGAGSSDPLADNSTPEGRALNRRIEFTLAPDTVE